MGEKITLRLEPAQVVVKPGERTNVTLTLQNRTEEVEQCWLELDEAQSLWADIMPSQISAFPHQDASAQITIHPPATAPGAIYDLPIRAVSQLTSGRQVEAVVKVQVPAQARAEPAAPAPVPAARSAQVAAQIQVQAEPVTEGKLPPPSMQWRLKLVNAGTILDTFSLSVRGLVSDSISVEPPEVTLKPGEQGAIVLTVRPSDTLAAGHYPLTVRVFSHLNPNQRTEVSLAVDIRARTGFKLSLNPHESESQGPREYKVTLTADPNSNQDLWLDLAAVDTENLCEFLFSPSPVFLPARQSVMSTLRVRPPTVLGANERKVHTLQITATPRDNPADAQVAEARLVQIGAAPLQCKLRPEVQTTEHAASYTVVIINPSTVETTLLLQATDPEEAADLELKPATLTIPARGQAQAQLRVTARAYNEGDAPRTIAFQVAATRDGEQVAAVKAEGSLVQKPVRAIPFHLVPPQQSSSGAARFVLRASNPRPSVARLWIEAHDEEDAVSLVVRPNPISLSPGAEGIASIEARPKDKLMAGEQRRVHKLTVTGQLEGSDKVIEVSGVLAQVRGFELGEFSNIAAMLARWMFSWAPALLLILILLVFGVAAVDELGCRSTSLNQLSSSIQSNPVGFLIVQRVPFFWQVRDLVRVLANSYSELTRATPGNRVNCPPTAKPAVPSFNPTGLGNVQPTGFTR